MLPFEAKYDGYGRGIDCNGLGKPIIESAIQVCGIYTTDSFSIGDFFECVHEGLMKFKTPWGESEADFMMIRKDIMDNILTNFCFEEYEDGGYVYHSFSDAVDALDDFISHVKIIKSDTSGIKHFIAGNAGKAACEDLWDVNIAVKFLAYEGYRGSNIVNYNDILMSEDRSLIIEHMKACFINRFMYETRRQWMPMGHEGSQTQNYAAHEFLCKTINKAANNDIILFSE